MAFAGQPEAREWKAPDGTVVKYRWSAPETLEAGKTYPLVLFLHGAGERGDDNTAQLKHGVIPILEGAEKLGDPCFLIAPQCPADRWWSPIDDETMRLNAAEKPNALLEAVLALVGDTMKNQPVDPKRFYVTGISMGGFATWDLLGRAYRKKSPLRSRFAAAAIPRLPRISRTSRSGPSTEKPTPPCRCKPTHEMIDALEKAGGKPKVHLLSGREARFVDSDLRKSRSHPLDVRAAAEVSALPLENFRDLPPPASLLVR